MSYAHAVVASSTSGTVAFIGKYFPWFERLAAVGAPQTIVEKAPGVFLHKHPGSTEVNLLTSQEEAQIANLCHYPHGLRLLRIDCFYQLLRLQTAQPMDAQNLEAICNLLGMTAKWSIDLKKPYTEAELYQFCSQTLCDWEVAEQVFAELQGQ